MNKPWPLTPEQRTQVEQELEQSRDELWLVLNSPPALTGDRLARWRHDLATRRKEIGRLERLLDE